MNGIQNEILIKLDELYKVFHIDGKQVEVLEDINLEVKQGEFISIVGVSGCGKSTLLRIIAGLEAVTRGNALFEDNSITKPSIHCGMVFQESRLFPWLNVSKNIEFGISQRIDKKKRREISQQHIELVGLKGFEKALPRQLSGGMQQRASIARGLVNKPKLLLLDEPFGALDAMTRIHMQNEVLRIWKAEENTMILVTHDIDEAIFLGDKVVVMSSKPGRVRKVIPVDIPRPRDRSSVNFMNIRKMIYKEFFQDTEYNIEYYL
ncbi:MAG: ABC transporter ATP-binding protein [Ruminiclostridium sp.]